MKFESYSIEDIVKFGRIFEQQMKEKTLADTLIENEPTPTLPATNPVNDIAKVSETAMDFLERKMSDRKSAKFKKVLAAATIVAKAKGIPTPVKDFSPVSLASTVDEGANRAKAAYQVSTGTLDPVEAADALIDSTAARVVAVADKVIEKGVPIVLNTVVDKVAKVFPPAKAVKPYVEHVAKVVTPLAKKAVRAGVKTLAKVAKTVVHSVASTVSKVGRKIFKFLFS